MEAVIARAKSFVLDCNNVDKKLRQLVDLTEDEANFHMKQSAFLYQLAVQTVPKSLHCLSMRLAVEYFRSPPPDVEQSMAEKYMNPSLQHFVIFSNNILASSVVINSTVMHSKVGSLHLPMLLPLSRTVSPLLYLGCLIKLVLKTVLRVCKLTLTILKSTFKSWDFFERL